MPLLYDGASSPVFSEPAHTEGRQDLAIVGFSFEFPDDATSSERFWQMICEGRCASADFPEDRLNIEGFYHPDESRDSTVSIPAECLLGIEDSPRYNCFSFLFVKHISSKRI